MRRTAVVLYLVPACVLALLLGVVVLAAAGGGGASAAACVATSHPLAGAGPTGGGRGSGGLRADALDGEQRGVVERIVGIGKQRQLGGRAWQVAIQVGATESKLRNLDHGDRDSLGVFQMRPSMGWGTPAQLQDISYQVNKFYDVLLKVPGWERMRPGNAAQAVERSGFEHRYHLFERFAIEAIALLGGTPADTTAPAAAGGPVQAQVVQVCGTPGTTAGGSEAAQRAIGFALAQRGKPYVWAATGPRAFDCSGLMLRAYEAAGIRLPRTSRQQFRAGAQVPIGQAQPGDLVFWARNTANPATIRHVAMVLGGGQIVEAQQSGVPILTRAFKPGERGLLPVAVRPGTQGGI